MAMEKAAEGNQPRTILNDYLAAKAAAGELDGSSAATTGRGEPSLKPAAIQAVAELPLDPATIEARPQSVALPLAGTKPGSGTPAKTVEVKPLLAAKALVEAKPAVEAKPLLSPLVGTKPASAAAPPAPQFETNPFVTGQPLSENKPFIENPPLVEAKPLAAEDSLPPIVPAWALPKPTKAATSGRGPQQPAASGQESGAKSQDRVAARPVSAPIQKSKAHDERPPAAEPLRIELGQSENNGQKPEAGGQKPEVTAAVQNSEFRMQNSAPQSPIPNPKSQIQNPSPVRPVDYETRGLAFQPAPRMLPAAEPADNDAEFAQLPEGSPFEAIQQSGTIKLRVRRSILLRTKVDVYRTAIVDEAVCDIVQFTPREVSIIGRSLGQTHVTFWFDDPAMAPLTYLVEVKPDAEQVKADEDKYQLLENVINEMFPDSKIHLVLVADKLLVKGQAKDSEEAAQIMTIVRAQSSIRGGGGGGVGGMGGGYGIAEGAATPVLSLQATGGNPGPQYQIINMLRVPGVQQVALKVKIAELNRSAARGFGVDVNAAINFSDSVEGTQAVPQLAAQRRQQRRHVAAHLVQRRRRERRHSLPAGAGRDSAPQRADARHLERPAGHLHRRRRVRRADDRRQRRPQRRDHRLPGLRRDHQLPADRRR